MVWRKVKLDKKPAVKAKAARRGRPKGSKNKPKGLEKQIAHWKAEPRMPKIDCVAIVNEKNDQIANLNHQITGYKAVISYLEYQLGLKKSQ